MKFNKTLKIKGCRIVAKGENNPFKAMLLKVTGRKYQLETTANL